MGFQIAKLETSEWAKALMMFIPYPLAKASGNWFRNRKLENQELQPGTTRNFKPETSNLKLFFLLYIHQNPLRAGLTQSLEGWNYSSFNEYINNSDKNICSKEIAYQLLNIPKENAMFIEQSYIQIVVWPLGVVGRLDNSRCLPTVTFW